MADAIFRTRVVADTAPFVRELRKLETKYNTFDIRLDLDGAKGATSAVDRLERQVVRSFANIRQQVGRSVRSFKALELAIRSSQDNMIKLNASMRAIGRSATTTSARVESAESQLRQFASARNVLALDTIDRKFDEISRSLRLTTTRTNQATTSMARYGTVGKKTTGFLSAALFGTASAVLGAGFAARAIGGAVAEVAKLNAEFDLYVRRTSAISRQNAESAQSFDQLAQDSKALREEALRLGETTVFTAREAAKAQAELAKAGFTAQENLTALDNVLDLAAAGQVDLNSATLIMARTLKGFQLEANEAARVTDVLAKTATASAIGVSDIGTAIKFVAPLAQQTAISVEETAAAIGLLGDAGFVGGIAGRGLRRALVNLIAPSNKAKEAMQALDVSLNEAAENPMVDFLRQLEEAGATSADVITIFGARAGPQMAALLETGWQELEKYTEELEAAGGTAEEIADEQLAGLQGSIVKLTSAWETFRIKLLANTGIDDTLSVTILGIRDSLSGIEDNFERILEPVNRFLILIEDRLGPALRNFGNQLTDDLVQVLNSGFDFLLDNGDELLGFISQFLTTLTDALSILLNISTAINTVLPEGAEKFLAALLAFKVVSAVLGSVATAIKGIGTAFELAASKAAVFRASAFIKTGLSGGKLAAAAAVVTLAIGGIVKAIEVYTRESRVAETSAAELAKAFNEALGDTNDYEEALAAVNDQLVAIRENALANELQDDLDRLREFAQELFNQEGIVLPALTFANLDDQEVIEAYRFQIDRIAAARRDAIASANRGRATDITDEAFDDPFNVNKTRADIDEVVRLFGVFSGEQDDFFALQDARIAAQDTGFIPLGVGDLPDNIADAIMSMDVMDEAEDIIGLRATELGARLTATLREGLVSQFAKGLALETFKPITGDDLIRGLLDLEADDTITKNKLQEFWQTNVVDVVSEFDQNAASAALAATEGLDTEALQDLILSDLPFYTGAARSAAASEIQDKMSLFRGLYADAVRIGLIDGLDDEVLNDIYALGGQEGGGPIIDALINKLQTSPEDFEDVVRLYQSSFGEAFNRYLDEEGEIQTSLANAIDSETLAVQYASRGELAARGWNDAFVEELLGIELPDFPALQKLEDFESKFSGGGVLIPEIAELKDQALSADLAARQAISAAEDALQAYANVNEVQDGVRVSISTTVTEIGEAADEIVVKLADSGTAGGSDMADNIYDELTTFANNRLPSIVDDINKQLTFTVKVDASTRTFGSGALIRHSGGPIPGPRGADVPVTAQAGEYMIQERAVRSLVRQGVDLTALNQGVAPSSIDSSRSQDIKNEVHIHTQTAYPETHGAKAASEIEVMMRRNF